MEEKQYFVETDVLEAAGSLALKRIGTAGNTLHLDFREITHKAKDHRNRYAIALKEVLDFVIKQEYNSEKKMFKLMGGGWINLINFEGGKAQDLPKGVTYITKDPASKIKHTYHNEIWEPPKFMLYDPQIFEKGVLYAPYTGAKDLMHLTLDDVVEKSEGTIDPDTLFNNQHIVVNNVALYKVVFPIIEGSEGRFNLNSDTPHLELQQYGKEVHGTLGNFKTRNREQAIAYNLIKSPTTEIIVIAGGSGTGKTVVPYQAGIEMILNKKRGKKKEGEAAPSGPWPFNRGMKIFKSEDIIGGSSRERGFLPGSSYDKARPHIASYMDAHRLTGLGRIGAFDQLLQDPEDPKCEFGQREVHTFGEYYLPPRDPAVTIEQLAYARGRTFENSVIIHDEAQNLTPFEMAQFIERGGIGSKTIIIGDVHQIDNERLDANFNGLCYITNLLIGQGHPRIGVVRLNKNYRSQAAEISSMQPAPKG